MYSEQLLNDDQVESIKMVIATLNGNRYGLSVAEQLQALELACETLSEQFPEMTSEVKEQLGI